jgi:hypothetical protein
MRKLKFQVKHIVFWFIDWANQIKSTIWLFYTKNYNVFTTKND